VDRLLTAQEIAERRGDNTQWVRAQGPSRTHPPRPPRQMPPLPRISGRSPDLRARGRQHRASVADLARPARIAQAEHTGQYVGELSEPTLPAQDQPDDGT
jgi:hypothetical protein